MCVYLLASVSFLLLLYRFKFQDFPPDEYFSFFSACSKWSHLKVVTPLKLARAVVFQCAFPSQSYRKKIKMVKEKEKYERQIDLCSLNLSR